MGGEESMNWVLIAVLICIFVTGAIFGWLLRVLFEMGELHIITEDWDD